MKKNEIRFRNARGETNANAYLASKFEFNSLAHTAHAHNLTHFVFFD